MEHAASPVRTLFAEIKFSHSIFSFPFAIFGAFLAATGWPSVAQLGLIAICMLSARTFAMASNRLIDRRLDAANPRTSGRALPAGRLSVGHARAGILLSGGVFLLACAGFAVLPAQPSMWPLWLGLPTLVFLAGYSYMKRFTSFCHLYLGAAIAFSPVAAWLAISPESLGWSAALLCAGVAFWIAGFDIIYALQDLEHDRRAGLHSVPARLGAGGALLVSRILHLLCMGMFAGVGMLEALGGWWWMGLGLGCGALAAEQALVEANDLSRVNLAFFTFNGVVSVVLGVAGCVAVVAR